MDAIEKLKRHSAVASAISLTAVYGVVAAIYLQLDATQHGIQETRITEYQERLSQQEDYREKYHSESKQRRESEIRNVQLSTQLDKIEKDLLKLTNAGWEQKFCAEQISRRSLEEELELSKQRYKAEVESLKSTRDDFASQNLELSLRMKNLPEVGQAKMTDSLKVFDELLQNKQKTADMLQRLQRDVEEKAALIADLQDKLKLAKDQNLKLREVVEKVPGSSTVNPGAENQTIAAIAVSLKSIRDDYYCLQALIRGVAGIKGGVTGSEFLKILNSASISDDYYCSVAVVQCIKYLKAPITSADVGGILASITDDYYNSCAAKAIMTKIDH